MWYDNTQVEFIGFEPNTNYKNMAKDIASSLSIQAPCYSKLYLNIEKTETGFQCLCKIVPRTDLFNEKATANSPDVALARVHKQIQKQLEYWRSIRFNENKSQQGGAA